jgi:predicted  nucleic acid-binding Zn-ribbon protein
MSTQPFQKLLALVELDKAIAIRSAERVTLHNTIAQEEKKIDELEQNERLCTEAVTDARKHVDSIELAMSTLEQKELRKKKLVDVANNLREFNSAKAELAAVHELIIAQEEAIVDAWGILEDKQKGLAAFQVSFPGALAAIQQSLSEKFQALQTCDDSIAMLKSQRPSYEALVPQEWLSQYATMQVTVANPVVPLHDDSCSACYSPVATQWAGRINRGAILPCKSCFRLLYAPDVHMRASKE